MSLPLPPPLPPPPLPPFHYDPRWGIIVRYSAALSQWWCVTVKHSDVIRRVAPPKAWSSEEFGEVLTATSSYLAAGSLAEDSVYGEELVEETVRLALCNVWCYADCCVVMRPAGGHWAAECGGRALPATRR